MKQFFVTMLGVFAGMLVFFLLLPVLFFMLIVGSMASSAGETKIKQSSILELDLRDGLADQDAQSVALFAGSRMSVMRVIQTMRHAETDDKVKAILVRLPEGGIAPATADELRLAFRHFRAAGKPILAHSQGLYPSGLVVSSYEVAAASGEIWMQPDSSFQVTGVTTSEMFLKRAFDKYGVKANYEQRYEYKNAVNPYLQSDYTPAHREATLSWMGSVFDSALAQAAADRKKDPAALKALIAGGPYSAEQARAHGLIDRVGQVHEAEEFLKARAGGKAEVVDFEDYAGVVKAMSGRKRGPTIAVIGAEGPIITGRGGAASPWSSDSTIYSDDTAKAFYDAIEDKDVKAIVFRVSSPGGSDTASEQILAAMRAAKKAGKPVVVSMGTYAASGGYWISSDASAIVAQPSTLTGSIGVYGGKFAIGDALARFGVDMRDLSVGGQYTDAFSPSRDFTPAQRAAFSSWMDTIYDGFVRRVAAGRKMPEARVRELAKGRVWTGAQAKQLGLVDEIGGFYEAVEKAKALAKIAPADEVRFKFFPKESSPFEALSKAFGVSETSMRTVAAAGWIMADPRSQALLDRMAEAKMREGGRAAVLSEQRLPAH
jgi:protease-4